MRKEMKIFMSPPTPPQATPRTTHLPKTSGMRRTPKKKISIGMTQF